MSQLLLFPHNAANTDLCPLSVTGDLAPRRAPQRKLALPYYTVNKMGVHTCHSRGKQTNMLTVHTRRKKKKKRLEARRNSHSHRHRQVRDTAGLSLLVASAATMREPLHSTPSPRSIRYQAISTDFAAQRRTRFLYASMSVLKS